VNASVVETHSSTLFFIDGRVYKRKKPLDLGFSDFRTREARLTGCQEEVRLNRRLSPDVYLGVADLVGTDGQLCDHFVVMRQMPDDRRLAVLASSGQNIDGVLHDVAAQLAQLHQRSPALDDPRHLAGAHAVRQLWITGLDALVDFPDLVSEQVRERSRELVLRWLAGLGNLLDERVGQGRVFEGHGDLLADDIFALPDGARILDCLEFDQGLRICDGLADAAFLAMDLERLGRPAAARTFLTAYEDLASDRPAASLEDFYLAYRAHIRSKVSCVRARQDPGSDAVARAREQSDLALAHLERGRLRLVLVGGLPGSGKTTIATHLAATYGWIHLSSDVTRKNLGGPASDEHLEDGFRSGRYSPERTALTYTALLRDARALLVKAESVVLDASWVDSRTRQIARTLAQELFADLVEVQCTAPPDVADTRILQRGVTSSDATPAIRRSLALRSDPWPEASELDTAGTLARTQHEVLQLLENHEPRTCPSGLLPVRRG
jgi:aminoglycoside phosphotransferase family enzyme/predicted kinase